ncbi:hypothetical protein ACVGXN_00185, partial [Enterobacter hormaechei]
TYSDHRSRPASFALYSAASARAMISAPTGWTAGGNPRGCVGGFKKTPGGGFGLRGLRELGKGWFCRPGKRSATRRNLQRPPIPPGLLCPVQRRIGAGDDFRP